MTPKNCQNMWKTQLFLLGKNAPTGQEMEYLESFYRVDPDRALSMIKKHIDQEQSVAFDLRNYDISSKKNYHKISTKEIEILGGYKVYR